MEQDPIQKDVRRARWQDRFGPKPQCMICHFRAPEALTMGKVTRRRLLELHHAAGRANDERLTVLLCLNCHAIESEKQRSAGTPLGSAPELLERIAGWLLNIGVFLPSVGASASELGRALQRFIGYLDQHFPRWREWRDE